MKRKPWSVTSISSLLVLVAIVVVINLISLRVFTRADLTEDGIYTLSKASRRAVANLDDRLTVRAFFTKDLPPPYNANARYVNDALEDYRSYSRGKFVYEFVDPADEEALQQEAQRYRVQPAQVNVMEKDNLQLKRVFMGLVLIYGDKHETIPLVQDVRNFEYEMTSAIKRLVAKKLPRVAFLSGFGMPDPGQDMRLLHAALSKHYEVTTVSTAHGNSLIDPEIDVLCVVQPEEPLDEWTKFCVDQYIMRGGKVGWFLNKVKADPQTSVASALQLAIDELTRSYGFVVANNLVCDLSASMINVQQQQGYFVITNMVLYPCFPRIVNINETHPMVKDLRELTLFYPSAIDTFRDGRSNVTFVPLLESTEHTRIQTGRFDINPLAATRREDYKGGRKLLGVAVSGTFASAFEGKSKPRPTDSLAAIPEGEILVRSPETRMVVIGDGNFVQGQYAQGGAGQVLFLNAVDWLAQDDDLMTIRSREAAVRPLRPDITDATKRTVKYANMFVPPAIVLVLGVVRWTIRRNRRKGLSL